MFVQNVKLNLSLNGIRYILRFILTVLELQNVLIAEERAFARERINVIFSVKTSQNEATQMGCFFRSGGDTRI